MADPITWITIISTVVSVAMKYKAGQDQKDAAKEDANNEQRRLQIVGDQRRLTQQRNEARLRREGRSKTASLINSAFASGVRYSSSFAGAKNAIAGNTNRESSFLNQTAALAQSADEITSTQIGLNKERTISNATSNQFSAIFEGIGTAAKAVASDSLFKGGSGAEDAVKFK